MLRVCDDNDLTVVDRLLDVSWPKSQLERRLFIGVQWIANRTQNLVVCCSARIQLRLPNTAINYYCTM